MATNPYYESVFTATTEDQKLANDLVVESIQIHGRDVFYVPRTYTNFDALFGEDAISSFNDVATIEMIMTNMTSWQGQNSFLSKFGLSDYDEATMQVSITRFAEEVTSLFPEVMRPREGDIIFLPMPYDDQKRAYEISKVEKENPFYALGTLYLYTLYIRVFEYNGETFNTGIAEIDDYEDRHSLTVELIMAPGVGEYTPGEQVSQGGGFSGEVVMFTSNKLVLNKVSGELDVNQAIIGEDSMTSRMVQVLETETGRDSMSNDNDEINQKIDDGLISFDETNGFSGV